MSFREASVCFNVPRSTLARRVLERNKVACGGKKHLGHYFPTFNTEFEAELVKYVKDMEPRYFWVPCIETHLFHFGNRKRRHMCDQPASTSQLRRSSLFSWGKLSTNMGWMGQEFSMLMNWGWKQFSRSMPKFWRLKEKSKWEPWRVWKDERTLQLFALPTRVAIFSRQCSYS